MTFARMYTTGTALAAILALSLLSACSDDSTDSSAKQPPTAPAAATPAAPAAATPAPVPAAPVLAQPDVTAPADRYVTLESGNQLMFQYYARTGLPLDYGRVAGDISNEYRQTTDAFRQRDLLAALKPRIDASLAQAKNTSYLRMDFDLYSSQLSAYDFDRKGFQLEPFKDASSFRYFNDNNRFHIAFSNAQRYAFLPVADEATARLMETLRTKYENLVVRAYLFANDADTSNQTVKAIVVRIVLLDKKGRELVQFAGPTTPEPVAAAPESPPASRGKALPYGYY